MKSVPYPALAIPVVTKQKYECPGDHINALAEALPNITKVLVIGWRGQETHFWEILQRHRLSSGANIMLVGRGGRTFNYLQEKFSNQGIAERQFAGYDRGFTNFVRDPIRADFLKD
jgi:hypothetical protein